MGDCFELVEFSTGQVHPVDGSKEYLAGRTREAEIFLYDLGCSRQQFRIVRREGVLVVEALSSSVPTACDGTVITAPVPLREGLEIEVHQTKFRVRQVAATIESPAHSAARVETSDRSPGQAFPVSGEMTIGREPNADVYLPHIQVSRRHARLRVVPDGAIVEDLGSANGTFLEGRRLLLPQRMTVGSTIGIGPYSLTFTGSALVTATRTNNLQLEGRSLTRWISVRSGSTSQRKTILDDVSLVIRPHEFVCLLGPTGSGKSTLLAALSARVPANQGQVLINQSNLYEHFESLKRDIAVVPQRDILHDALPLVDALHYTARLRLPIDTSAAEMTAQVDDMLQRVGLLAHRQTCLGQLSGGQRRRASLANELISNPSLLFLDEVTSGLDEQTDREMMRLFRRLADAGKTVVCVTHTLANIAETCHLVVLLTVGGKLAFVGTPAEALEHFQIERLADVYEKLERDDEAEEWQRRFMQSPLFGKYVTSRLSVGSVAPHQQGVREIRFWHDTWQTARHQWPLLARRYWQVFRADRRSLWGLALQVLIVAAVLSLVFGDVSVQEPAFRRAAVSCNVLFVLGVSGLWFGCNNSVKEIVRERTIYTKELQVNLDPASYYASKWLLQIVAAGGQSVALAMLVSTWCSVPGSLATQAGLSALGAAAGVCVGLFLSAISKTEAAALTLVPLVLIPQIALSDVFVPLEGFSRWLGQGLVANYWIYGALRGTLPDELVEQLNPPLAQPLPLDRGLVAVSLQMVALMLSSVVVLHVRDRVMACSNKSFLEAVEELPVVGRTIAAMARRFLGRRSRP